ncbi:hypothetical protein KEM55_004261 [Ascosphaera atra]|nr:hypothetical protein KEM55_004261 [Ascosphaera atra]
MSDSSDSYLPEDEAESTPTAIEDKHDLPFRNRNTPPPKPEPQSKPSQSQPQSQHVPRPKRPSELKRNARNAERKHLINRYVPLYNEAVRAIEAGTIYDPEPPHYPGKRLQYGAVTWDRRERDAFYDGLARYGKGGTAQIASLVGSKSELEVRALVGLHEKSLAYRGVKVKQRRLVGWRAVMRCAR